MPFFFFSFSFFSSLLLPLLLALLLLQGAAPAAAAAAAHRGHSKNYAVLVSTSKFFHNYRHSANVLSFYRICRNLGIPDANILVMFGDESACNSRNGYPGMVWNDKNHERDLYGEDVQVDWKGNEVTVENFLRVLTGRHAAGTPRSKRLMTDETSNVLIYLSGHGGDGFLKFQDAEEIGAEDLAEAVAEMRATGRFNEMLIIADTCQASTLAEAIKTPGVVTIGSSARGENSYSHHTDPGLGLAQIDRFTYRTLEFFDGITARDKTTSIGTFFRSFDPTFLKSHAIYRDELALRNLDDMPVTDFFANVADEIGVTSSAYPI